MDEKGKLMRELKGLNPITYNSVRYFKEKIRREKEDE
jgi:hypothetical protein